MERAAEQLEVVRDDDERPDGDERRQPGRVGDRAVDPERDGASDRDHAQPDQGTVGDPGLQRVAFQLVEGMRSDADGEEEGRERDQKPVGLEMRRQGGANRDVREVPERVRRVEQRQVVPPTARLQCVEGRAALAQARRPQTT